MGLGGEEGGGEGSDEVVWGGGGEERSWLPCLSDFLPVTTD